MSGPLRALTLTTALALAAVVAGGCTAPWVGLRPPDAPPVTRAGGVEHGWEVFSGAGGLALFGQWWRPASGPARATLVVMHGLKDRSGRYAGLARLLVARGFAVYAFDLPGHGRSAGDRVAVGSFDDYVTDLCRWIVRTRTREPGRPLFLMGHSMGGAVAALLVATRDVHIDGLILSGAALRLDVWPITVALTRGLVEVAPGAPALSLDNRDFSSDPRAVAAMSADPLIYQDAGPAHTAAELVEADRRIWAGVGRFDMPLLLLHGSADRLTSPRGSRDLYDRAPARDKTLVIYRGFFHDLLHEPGGARVAARIEGWLEGHSGGAASTAMPATAMPATAAPATAAPVPEVPAPHHPAVSLTTGLVLARTGAPERFGHHQNLAAFELGSRVALGGPLGLCLGAGGSVGATAGGVAYRADVYPLGLAARLGHGADLISLCLGAGRDGAADAIPGAWRLPLEARAELSLGPVRALAWARAVWIAGSSARQDGAGVSWTDEIEAGAGVRLSRDERYWAETRAGAGLYLGAQLRRMLGSTWIGAVVGASFWGGE